MIKTLTHKQSVNFFLKNNLHPELNLPWLINSKGMVCNAKQTKQVINKVLAKQFTWKTVKIKRKGE